MNTETFRCWAEINREALRRNARAVRDRIGSAEILAVVKANAYGHGMVGVAETLADQVQLFGVANLEEAIALRAAVPHPIIILGPSLPQEMPEIVDRGFIPSISNVEEAEQCDQLAKGAKVSVNFKVDTGMGRMGATEGRALPVFQRIAGLPSIHVHSISTHMPVSNEDEAYTREQLVRFRNIVENFRMHVP